MTTTRPSFPTPANLPASLAATMVAAADRKAVYVNLNGDAFWLNDTAQAEAVAAKNGGTVYPPKA